MMSLTARDKQYFDDNMLTDEDFDFGGFYYTGKKFNTDCLLFFILNESHILSFR